MNFKKRYFLIIIFLIGISIFVVFTYVKYTSYQKQSENFKSSSMFNINTSIYKSPTGGYSVEPNNEPSIFGTNEYLQIIKLTGKNLGKEERESVYRFIVDKFQRRCGSKELNKCRPGDIFYYITTLLFKFNFSLKEITDINPTIKELVLNYKVDLIDSPYKYRISDIFFILDSLIRLGLLNESDRDLLLNIVSQRELSDLNSIFYKVLSYQALLNVQNISEIQKDTRTYTLVNRDCEKFTQIKSEIKTPCQMRDKLYIYKFCTLPFRSDVKEEIKHLFQQQHTSLHERLCQMLLPRFIS